MGLSYADNLRHNAGVFHGPLCQLVLGRMMNGRAQTADVRTSSRRQRSRASVSTAIAVFVSMKHRQAFADLLPDHLIRPVEKRLWNSNGDLLRSF
jgi:hypothetical protein